MQVTSSHVSIWFDFPASYDEYPALVKFGNVASEHVKSAISVVQPQLSAAQQNPSAVQQNRVGALVTHHPAWMSHHTSGSRQGHPRYTGAQQWEGRGWPDQEISQSAAHRHTKRKSCLTDPDSKKHVIENDAPFHFPSPQQLCPYIRYCGVDFCWVFRLSVLVPSLSAHGAQICRLKVSSTTQLVQQMR